LTELNSALATGSFSSSPAALLWHLNPLSHCERGGAASPDDSRTPHSEPEAAGQQAHPARQKRALV